MSASNDEKGGMVGFKLKGKHFKKLEARATRAGISRHLQAQAMIESVLEDRDEEMVFLKYEVSELRAEVEAIKAGLIAIFSKLMARGSTEKSVLEKARSEVERAFARKDER